MPTPLIIPIVAVWIGAGWIAYRWRCADGPPPRWFLPACLLIGPGSLLIGWLVRREDF